MIAALAVFDSHMIHRHFGDRPLNPRINFDYSADAVVLFFVLPGYVVSYAADANRQSGATVFLFNRVTRLRSVVIPAIVLTRPLDAVGAGFAPDMYETWRGTAPEGSWGFVLGRIPCGQQLSVVVPII